MGLLVYTVGGVVVGLVLLRRYLHRKWGQCSSQRDMSDKTVIITGANCGLGKVTARELAKRNARVILACRDVAKAEQAVADIRRHTSRGQLLVKRLDLSSFQSIRSFVRDILSSEPRLDVLINNAGVYQCPYSTTAEGFETQFGVNHLGHFLLTNLLRERLESSPPSRVVIVSSMLHKSGVINFDNLSPDAETYDRAAAYRNSKLANVMFGRQLWQRVRDARVDVFIVCPGMVWTNAGRHVMTLWTRMVLAVVGIFFVRTPMQGCQTILHCALAEELEGRGGTFYRNCRQMPFCPAALCEDTASRLWQVSEQLTKLHK